NTALNLYLKGEIDVLDELPSSALDFFRYARSDTHTVPALSTYFYRFNCTRFPFSDPTKGRLVRRAFNQAIDKQFICVEVARLGQVPAASLVPHSFPTYHPPEGLPKFDPAEARRLLAEAGFAGGAGFPRVKILYNTSEGHKSIAAAVQNDLLKNLGVTVELENREWQTYLADQSKLNYDLCRASWIGDYNDPNTFLDMFVTNGGNNNTGWSNPLYDRLMLTYVLNPVGTLNDAQKSAALAADCPAAQPLIARWRAESDPARREEMGAELRMVAMRRAEEILCAEESPILPLYHYTFTDVYDEQRVKNWHMNGRDIRVLKWVYREKE
ncbi:MAG: hypothetical protein HY719_01955, partial [Planctomycetes bacterium]|nr:hypothetical protein [Planctomycetota bacterium]